MFMKRARPPPAGGGGDAAEGDAGAEARGPDDGGAEASSSSSDDDDDGDYVPGVDDEDDYEPYDTSPDVRPAACDEASAASPILRARAVLGPRPAPGRGVARCPGAFLCIGQSRPVTPNPLHPAAPLAACVALRGRGLV